MQQAGYILVIDDDNGIREVIQDFLSDEGYRVETVRDGRAALQLAGEQSPCLILLDMLMPIMDGRAFCEAYRLLPGPHAPIVVLTATFDGQISAAEISAQDYLSKPFSLDDLLDTVRRHLF